MNTTPTLAQDAKRLLALNDLILDGINKQQVKAERAEILARHHAAGTTANLIEATERVAEAKARTTIKCDYASDCTDAAEYLGRKGYVYCPRHRGHRMGYEATRPLRKWEQKRILEGKPLVGWFATQADARVYDAEQAED